MRSLEFCVCLKPWFLDEHQVKVTHYHRYLLLNVNTEHYWMISASYCVRNLEKTPKAFVISVKKTFLRKKSCSLLRGVNGTAPNTLNFFWLSVLLIFSLTIKKNYQTRFLHNNFLILCNKVLWYCKSLSNDGNEWLLLDVNPKTKILGSKAPKLLKKFSKSFLNDLVINLLILFVI